MLMEQGDGTYLGGPLDVLCVLHDAENERYHAAFFEEKPMPGKVRSVEDTPVVRLKSKFHHTEGADNLADALVQLDELSAKIRVDKQNICRAPIPWDGVAGIVWTVPNWQAVKQAFGTVRC